MRKLIVCTAILAVALVPQAKASVELDFGIPSLNGGLFSWGGNGSDLFATNLGVSDVAGISTPNNPGTSLAIANGTLNATSGPGTFVGNIVSFGAGAANSITINGSILGNTTEVLLSGQVTSAKLETLYGQTVLDLTGFTNSIASDLAAHFGVPTFPWAGAFHVDFTLPTGVSLGQPFNKAGAGSGDLVTSPVPEPSSLTIAALGALGLLGYGIRRRRGV
ncbi:MAG: PEP-CTERM sorting domain-containing protein [Isosphaeraceae bacterium]